MAFMNKGFTAIALLLILIATTLLGASPNAITPKQVAVSLDNDTIDIGNLQGTAEITYLLHFKQPYCHDCLPEVVKKLGKIKPIAKSLYVLQATASPLHHKMGYDVLKQKGVKFSQKHYLRVPDTSTNWRGYLYLQAYQEDSLLKTWSYKEIVAKSFRKSLN